MNQRPFESFGIQLLWISPYAVLAAVFYVKRVQQPWFHLRFSYIVLGLCYLVFIVT